MAANISAGEVWAQASANEIILTGLLIAIGRSPEGRSLVEQAFEFPFIPLTHVPTWPIQ